MMSTQSSDQRRGPARVDFRAPIRVLSNESQVCWATSSNLSMSGIRVSSMETFSVGTELGLDIPVPGGEDSLAFNCKVVWVERERRCGMGLEFLDLNEEERGSLRQLVASKDLKSTWSRKVKIWFDGQPMPMNAKAIPTQDGLVVGIELPHLRQMSQVIYRFEEQDGSEGEAGTLEGVYLEPGDVPLLMATIRPDDGFHHTITTWPPPPTEEEVQKQAAEQALTLETQTPKPPEVEVEQEMLSGEITARALPMPPETCFDEEEISVEIQQGLPTEEVPDISSPSHEQVAALSPDQGAREQSFQKMRELESSGVRNLWLWIAAIAMTGLAVASMAYTGMFDRVQNASTALSSDGEEPALVAPNTPPPGSPIPAPKTPEPEPAPALKPEPAPALKPEPAPAPKPESAPETPKPEPAPALKTETPKLAPVDAPVSTHQPTYLKVSGGLQITIPIKGSTSDAKHYTVDTPNGIAINLPNARATHSYGTFRITDQKLVRLYWVKKRMGGLHLRLFFSGKAMRDYTVDLQPGLVMVTVKE